MKTLESDFNRICPNDKSHQWALEPSVESYNYIGYTEVNVICHECSETGDRVLLDVIYVKTEEVENL